jgi:hypothetical protein
VKGQRALADLASANQCYDRELPKQVLERLDRFPAW